MRISSFRSGVHSSGFRVSGSWSTIPSHPLPASSPSNDIFVDNILPPPFPEFSSTLLSRVEKETEGDESAASRLERDGEGGRASRLERDGEGGRADEGGRERGMSPAREGL